MFFTPLKEYKQAVLLMKNHLEKVLAFENFSETAKKEFSDKIISETIAMTKFLQEQIPEMLVLIREHFHEYDPPEISDKEDKIGRLK